MPTSTRRSAPLQTLDRPAKAALIEVTVAELALTENGQLGGGVATATKALSSGAQIIGGTGADSMGAGGATFRVLDTVGAVRATLNASRPPTRPPSSQARAYRPATARRRPSRSAKRCHHHQPAQHRSARQLPRLCPTRCFGDGAIPHHRVILRSSPSFTRETRSISEVTQEVSAAAQTNTGVNSSPTFSTRLDTKLTLRNGATVLMGV